MQNEQERIREIICEIEPDVEAFLDVNFEVEVVVGSTWLTVGELLELQEGESVQLDQLADCNLIVSIAEHSIAEAEILKAKGTIQARLVDRCD